MIIIKKNETESPDNRFVLRLVGGFFALLSGSENKRQRVPAKSKEIKKSR